MLRNVWFQLHWFVGISFGLVLAVVGLTGALLSYEQPFIQWLNRDVMTVTVPAGVGALPPAALLEKIGQQLPERRVTTLGFSAAPDTAIAVTFVGGARGAVTYANPYTGEITGQAQGLDAMGWVRRLHRWLLLDIHIGRPLVGVATALLILLALSGLYLRWPRKVWNWRRWLALDWRKKGRSFVRHVHIIVGTWVLLFYVLAAATGLWWSFDWYRAGLYQLAGVEQPQRQPPAVAQVELGSIIALDGALLDRVWLAFRGATPDMATARLSVPQTATDKINIRYLTNHAAHERATDTQVFDAATGKLLAQNRYADKTAGEQFMASIFPLHAGSYFGALGTFLMMLASLAMPLFAVTGWMLYLKRRQSVRG